MQRHRRPRAEKLDFRDIEAFDANTAYILSVGNRDLSRIYKTTDGGKTRQLQFKNDAAEQDEAAFAASGTCRITQGNGTTFLVTGGGDAPVFRSGDRGVTSFVTPRPRSSRPPLASGRFVI